MTTLPATWTQPRPLAAGFAASIIGCDLGPLGHVHRDATAPRRHRSVIGRGGPELPEVSVDAYGGGHQWRRQDHPGHPEQGPGGDREAEHDQRIEPEGGAVDDRLHD